LLTLKIVDIYAKNPATKLIAGFKLKKVKAY